MLPTPNTPFWLMCLLLAPLPSTVPGPAVQTPSSVDMAEPEQVGHSLDEVIAAPDENLARTIECGMGSTVKQRSSYLGDKKGGTKNSGSPPCARERVRAPAV